MPGKRKANGFIQDLAKCHAAQVVPLLKRADNEQWQELKEVLKKVDNNEINLGDVRLPRASARWLKGAARGKHKDIAALRRSVTQRGGSKAELFGTVLKTVAKAAAPALKKAAVSLGKQAASTSISTGIEKAAKKLKSTPRPETSSPEPSADDIDDILKKYA